MRKIIYTLVLTVATVFMANAQTPIKAGAHIGYGSKIKNVGFGVNGEIGVMDKLFIAPSFTYFLTKSYGNVSHTYMEFNADAHYNFMEDQVTVYGLGGLNYTYFSYTSKGVSIPNFGIIGPDTSYSNGEIGLNLGGGINFNLGSNLVPFAELKFTLGSTDQLFLGGGVRYIFK